MAPKASIRSTKNPSVQLARAVLEGRDKTRVALEGDRLIDDALRAGFAVELALVSDARLDRAAELERRCERVELVDDELLGRISSLSSSPGAIAIARAPARRDLGSLEPDRATLLLCVAGVADPGNLGALARSAEAAGARGVLIARGGVAPWNAKALRGSMGSLLRLPVYEVDDVASAARQLSALGVRGVCAHTRGGADYRRFDWSGPLCLWVGAETGELAEALRALERVSIPMRGATESLNVTVAASLLLFEAARARGDSR